MAVEVARAPPLQPQCREGKKNGAKAPFFFHTSRSCAATSKPAPHKDFGYGKGFAAHTVQSHA